MDEKIPLFVYGTLLTNYSNWSWALAPQKGVPAKLQFARMYHLGGFPGIKHSLRDEEVVIGELFYITREQLEQIDRLEGYRSSAPEQSFYRRELVTLMDGSEAYTYFYNRDVEDTRLIISGSWHNQKFGKEI